MNWFWFFGLAMVLVIPVSMCIAGLRWRRGKIPRYGGASGYCTKQSQRSPAAWAFAHLYFGRLWTILGAAMALLGIVAMLLCIGGVPASVILFLNSSTAASTSSTSPASSGARYCLITLLTADLSAL